MASKALSTASSLASRAKAAVHPAFKYVGSNYSAMLKANEQFVVKDPAAKANLGKQFLYTNLAEIPAELNAASAEWATLKAKFKTKAKDMTLNEYGTYALFAAEAYAWFCVGEIAGRGFRFVDYDYE
mmetsp:Transcript_35704/g.91144  ORF Transcript_35704/g.91144 Transcript_35704/m.91144 type:complete len:127 (-) Transcript_35704:64-444(-)